MRDIFLSVVLPVAGGIGSASLPGVDPTAGAVIVWVWGAVGVAFGANALFSLWKNLTGGLKEQPPPVSTYRTLAACESLHSASEKRAEGIETLVHNEFATFRACLATHNTEAESRASKIHARIDALVTFVHTNAGRLDEHLRQHNPGGPR